MTVRVLASTNNSSWLLGLAVVGLFAVLGLRRLGLLLVNAVVVLALVLSVSWPRLASLITTAVVVAASSESLTSWLLLSSVLRANYWLAVWTGYIRCLVALLSLNNVELDLFTLANTLLVLVWVVLGNGALVDKDILVAVISGNESITVLDVEPLDGTRNFGGQKFSFDYWLLKLDFAFKLLLMI